MECIVTGITEMGGTKVCMSLYSLTDNCYIRPLKNGDNFNINEINGIGLYSVVKINPSEDVLSIRYPHCEDINIKPPYFRHIGELKDNEQYDFFDRTSYGNVSEIFGRGNLIKQKNSWGVLIDTGERSLGSVEVEEFEITKNDFDPDKPVYRVNFTDIEGNKYSNIKFVMKATISEKDEMVGYYYKDNEEEQLFLRLSLARKWKHDSWEHEMCTLQVSCFACFEGVTV